MRYLVISEMFLELDDLQMEIFSDLGRGFDFQLIKHLLYPEQLGPHGSFALLKLNFSCDPKFAGVSMMWGDELLGHHHVIFKLAQLSLYALSVL